MAEAKKEAVSKAASTPKVQEVEAKVKTTSVSSSTKPANGNADNMAIASLILGVISICGSFCGGLCCTPFALLGLVLGILGMKSEKNKTMAIMGVVLSGLSIVLIIVSLVTGTLLNLSNYANKL